MSFSGVEMKVRKGRQVELLRSSSKQFHGSAVNDIIIVFISIKFLLINIDTQRYVLVKVYHGTPAPSNSLYF